MRVVQSVTYAVPPIQNLIITLKGEMLIKIQSTTQSPLKKL